MRRTTRRLAGVLIAGGALLAAPSAANAVTIAGSGSSASVPYLEALFKGYKALHPKTKFVFTANNGNAGAQDVQAHRSAFAIQTRPPLPSDSGLSYSKLFLDALTVSVNPANKLTGLSVGQIKDIFTGTTTEWSAFPGSGLSSPISAFGRNSTAGLFTFFTSAVLGGDAQGTNVTPLDKDGEVAVAVKKNPAGIGYVGLANSGAGSGVKRLAINGIAPTQAKIKSLKYPLTRYAWLVLPSKRPNRIVQQFGDWVRTSYAAGRIIAKAGAVPAFNATRPPKKASKKRS